MDEILKLTQEKSTWLFLADGLTQEHQQSVKLDILRKVDNLQSQIDALYLGEWNEEKINKGGRITRYDRFNCSRKK